jgi:FR47-like protein
MAHGTSAPRRFRIAYRGIFPDAFVNGLSVEKRESSWRDSLAVHEPPSALIIYAIYLRPETQRKGLGTLLVLQFVHELDTLGFGSMAVWVLALNPSSGEWPMIYLKNFLAGVGALIACYYLLSRSASDCLCVCPLICRKVPAMFRAPRGFRCGSFCSSRCLFLPQPAFGPLENCQRQAGGSANACYNVLCETRREQLNHKAATDIDTLSGDET